MKINELDFFQKNGYVLIKNFYKKKKIAKLKYSIFKLSEKIFIEKYKKKIHFKKNDFDSYINYSVKKKLNFHSSFYEVVKKIYYFNELLINSKIKKVIKKIFKTSNFGMMNKAYGFRFDYPRDKKFLTQLHQEYTSNLGCSEGVVCISSLNKIKLSSGPIEVFPKTHKLGILPIKILKNNRITKSRKFVLKDEKKFNNLPSKKIMMNETDLLILNFLTLHKSNYNFSKKTRITFLARYINFDSGTGAKIFYSDGQQGGKYFNDIHPELVVN
jgi:hypothetical protein